MVKLYHYTDRKGLEGIIKSGKILAMSPHGGTTDMPYGVYLTELKPSTITHKLILNNYDDMARVLNAREFNDKVKFYFEIESEDFPKAFKRTETHRNEWVIPHDIDLNEILTIGHRAGRSDERGNLQVGAKAWPRVPSITMMY